MVNHPLLQVIFAKRVPDPSVLDDNDDKGGSPKDIAAEMIAEWGSDGALNQTQFFALLEDNDFWPLMSVWGGSEAPAVEEQSHASEAEVCSPPCASPPMRSLHCPQVASKKAWSRRIFAEVDADHSGLIDAEELLVG